MDETKTELEITRVGSPSEGVEKAVETAPPAPVENRDDQYFEGELQRVMGERDNYKKGLLEAKRKLKIRDTGEEISVDEFDEKVNQAAEAIVESRLTAFQTDFVKDVLDETLSKISANPKEKELIQYHYANTIKTTGFSRQAIERDLARAKILANESRFANENAELKNLLIARQTATQGNIGTNQDRIEAEPELNISRADRELYERLAQKAGVPLEEYLKKLRKERKI